jgi:hypothetical protein
VCLVIEDDAKAKDAKIFIENLTRDNLELQKQYASLLREQPLQASPYFAKHASSYLLHMRRRRAQQPVEKVVE